MPKINLKPRSPEFAENRRQTDARRCDMPGCDENADHRAPKDRALSDHYWFCYDHVCDYNKAWNFFAGMSDEEIHDHMLKSLYGDRPTWRYDNDGAREDMMYRAAWKTYNFTDEEPPNNAKQAWEEQQRREREISEYSPEGEALAIFDLAPPLNLDDIKKRYKDLAKKHHPDRNPDNRKESEDLLKKINMAYTVLKLAHEKFEKLD